MSNTSTSNLLSVDSVKESSLSVISEQEILGKSFKVYGTFEEPLILASDVAEWIEYDLSSINKLLKNVDDDEKLNGTIFRSGQNRDCWFLTENGVYEVLMQSRKPVAKDFKKQVKAILHELRTTGKVEIQQPAQKSDRELDLLEKQLEIEDKKARTASADLLLKLANKYEGKSKTYGQILDAYASKELTGQFALPLPATQKTYSAEDVAKELGISAVKVGRIANFYGLKTDEYGCWQKDKSKYADKEVDAFRYFENAISVIAEHKDEKISKDKKIEKSSNQSDLFSN